MSNNDFFRVVDEAVDLGTEVIHLTPGAGDIFCDPNVYEKIDYVENKRGVKKIWFFTNYFAAKPERLKGLRKTRIYVSEYGKSDEEFTSLTNRPASYRHKVLENLEKSRDLAVFSQARSYRYIDQCWENSKKKRGLCYNLTNPYVYYNLDLSLCFCGVMVDNYNFILGNLNQSTMLDLVVSDKTKTFLREQIKERSLPCSRCSSFIKQDLNVEILKLIGK
jgi:hypothetical protein